MHEYAQVLDTFNNKNNIQQQTTTTTNNNNNKPLFCRILCSRYWCLEYEILLQSQILVQQDVWKLFVSSRLPSSHFRCIYLFINILLLLDNFKWPSLTQFLYSFVLGLHQSWWNWWSYLWRCGRSRTRRKILGYDMERGINHIRIFLSKNNVSFTCVGYVHWAFIQII